MIKRLKDKYSENIKEKDFAEVLNGSVLSFIAKILAVIFGFVTSLLVAKYYGPEVIGTVSILFSIMSVTLIFSLLGIDVSILRFIPPLLKQNNYYKMKIILGKSLGLVLALSLISSSLLFIYSDLISDLIFHKSYLSPLIILIAFFVPFNAIGIFFTSVIRALKEIKFFIILQFLPSLLNLIVLLGLTFTYYHKYNPLYSQLFALIISMILGFLFLYKILKNHTNRIKIIQKEGITYREILSISFPMFLTTVMQAIMLQTDILMLGSMSTVENVGIYAIVMKLGLLSIFMINSINTMIAPKFSELYYNNEIDALKIVAKKSTKLIFYSTLPITFVLMLFGDNILSIFGLQFIDGYTALIFLSIGQSFNALSGSVGYILNMTGQQKIFNKIILLGAFMNILLNIIFIPKYGINGAAFASMCSTILWNILASIYVKRHLNFSIWYLPLIKE